MSSHVNKSYPALGGGFKTVINSSYYLGSNNDFTKAFHTFGLNWQKGLLEWYVDGVKRFSTTDYVPEVNMYIIANLAIDGSLAKKPDPSTYPKYMEIDYIKTWQKKTMQTCQRCSVYYDKQWTQWQAVDCNASPSSTTPVVRTYKESCVAPAATRKTLQCSRCSVINDKEYTWWERSPYKTCRDNPPTGAAIMRARLDSCTVTKPAIYLSETANYNEYITGDYNHDQEVNLKDIVEILKNLDKYKISDIFNVLFNLNN